MRNALKQQPAIQSFQSFCRGASISDVTGWRMRKKGWIETINIAGRPYVTADAIDKFLARATAGEFSKAPTVPRRSQTVLPRAGGEQ